MSLARGFPLPHMKPTASAKLTPSQQPINDAEGQEVNSTLPEEVAASSLRQYADSTSRTPAQTPMTGVSSGMPAYVMPATPSPFMHSQYAPQNGAVPPLTMGGFDMGLGAAYGCEGSAGSQAQQGLQEHQEWGMQVVDSQYMSYMAEAMADPGYASYIMQQMQAAQGWDAMSYHSGDSGAFDGMIPDAQLSQKNTASSAEWETHALVEEAQQWQEPELPTKGAPVKKGQGRGRGRKAQQAAQAATHEDEEREPRRAAGQAAAESDEMPANCTTVMLRNIPNKYTREMLIDQLNRDFNGMYDFLYLPIDFKNKCNVGYGFINFRTPDACGGFVSQFNGVSVQKCLPGLNSKKIVEVTPARVQGLSENVRRLQNSPVMNQLVAHPEWMPLLFNDRGFEEPFPKPDQPLPPTKARGRGRMAHS